VTGRRPVWAVVPVKPFGIAKGRLEAVLDAGDRASLARLMFEDVLTVLMMSHVLDGVLVLTSDSEAAHRARNVGALVLDESVPAGLNAAVAMAIDHLTGITDAGMVVVPADLPHLSSEAVELVVRQIDAPTAVALLPAVRDGGTNLLACRPADVIEPRFGPNSFELHCQAARRAGLSPRVLDWPGLEHDIDRPEDVAAFLSIETATRSDAFLRQALSRGIISRAIVSI
jgi:2-phospho-L-lactate/phosphoenolpyruvate guanylyltransferase